MNPLWTVTERTLSSSGPAIRFHQSISDSYGTCIPRYRTEKTLFTKERSGHAIVLGASIGGLLAARVLSESYAKVTIFDRDELPRGPHSRKGVPQGEHPHGLLARGRQVLEELFEGFTADLTAAGAIPVDLQRDCVWINDGHPLARAASGLQGLCVSRPALEGYVRGRVASLPNVVLVDRHEVVGLLATDDRSRVTGVRVRAWAGQVSGDGSGQVRHVAADLVVDATGRGNRGPRWLAEIGYAAPEEDTVNAGTVYMSRDYARTPGDADFTALVMSPSPQSPYGAVALAAEGERWMVTLIGVGAGNAPPADPDAFLDFAARLPNPQLYDLLRHARPLGAPRKMRLPSSVRRRYERLRRLPAGFIAFADASCSFNPAYGQGMTVAAAEAIELRACLRAGRDGLPQRFYARAAKVIDVPWDIAVGADLRFAEVVGARTAKVKVLNGYVAKVHIAAQRHPVVGRAFLRVANLMAPPPSLFAPAVLARVLWSGRRGAAQPPAAVEPGRELEMVG
jgi:2-polyprenyl-6-methoxyphenol hydroxylase-like FAD-dependent oxidoreductase